MSLTWKGLTADQFAAELEASATETRRRSKTIMRQGAKDIMEGSKDRAPVDEGNLEEAHELAIVRLNKDDMMVEISVGGVVNGVDVDEYAWIMHERLAPFGDLNLGPKSVAKNAAAQGDRYVGGKFLERSVDELEPEIIEKITDTLPGS